LIARARDVYKRDDFGLAASELRHPVAITTGEVYVASYHTNVGRYANDDNYFATAGVDNGPLHALRDGVSGSNGFYMYSWTPTFPKATYRATNYWVDVVFE